LIVLYIFSTGSVYTLYSDQLQVISVSQRRLTLLFLTAKLFPCLFENFAKSWTENSCSEVGRVSERVYAHSLVMSVTVPRRRLRLSSNDTTALTTADRSEEDDAEVCNGAVNVSMSAVSAACLLWTVKLLDRGFLLLRSGA